MDATSQGSMAGAALAGTRFADVRWVSQTGSTNADVLELARRGEPEGIVLVADHQLGGRGRRGRTWDAPAGSGLMVTVLLRPQAPVAGLTTMALALAAAEAVESLTGLAPGLKWPNDLVWPQPAGPDRKLAGILAEAEWPSGTQVAAGWSAPGPAERVVVAAGIGLNVTWGGAKPAALDDLAVALDELTDAVPARVDLLIAMLRALDGHYATLHAGPDGVEAVRSAWRRRSATLGRRVRVDLGADDVVGTAVDITDEGHLVVDTLEGERRTLAVGDVVHLRAEG